MAFTLFDAKHKQMRLAIKEMESAVVGKRAEVDEAERALRTKLESAIKELERPPPAGALVWRGRRG